MTRKKLRRKTYDQMGLGELQGYVRTQERIIAALLAHIRRLETELEAEKKARSLAVYRNGAYSTRVAQISGNL